MTCQRGQMSILITMIFLTLFILFAFVINVGILISEKINLQNAADLGAYAGASMQARVLNKIGFLNYRLRQEWKEFTFHHWVTLTRSETTHPVHYLRPPPTQLAPMDQPYTGGEFYVPCICIAGQGYRGQASNFCQSGCSINLPGVREVKSLYVSPLVQAIKTTTDALRKTLASEWIRLGNESEEMAINTYYPKYKQRTDSLYQKILAYANFLNEVGTRTDPSDADDPISTTALITVLKNLSYGNRENLRITSLIPDSDTPWIKLDPIEALFLITYAKFIRGKNEARLISTNAQEQKMMIGVSKDPSVVTYYALRLISKPNLIYLPEHWEPTLVAYSAAKPFGSRIGPQISRDASTGTPGSKISDQKIFLASQSGEIGPPNFSFQDDDRWGLQSAGQMDLIRTYFPYGYAEETSYPTASKSNPNFYALLSIRSPNHYEAMRYSIFADPTKNLLSGDLNIFEISRYPDAVESNLSPNLFAQDDGIKRANLYNLPTPKFNATDTDGESNDMLIDQMALKDFSDPDGKLTHRANILQTRTAWCNDIEFENQWGRTGYSVKLVNMNQLVSIIFTRGGSTVPIQNLPTGDDNVTNTQRIPVGRRIWH